MNYIRICGLAVAVLVLTASFETVTYAKDAPAPHVSNKTLHVEANLPNEQAALANDTPGTKAYDRDAAHVARDLNWIATHTH